MPSVFWNFVGLGAIENAMSDELLCSIRCRPTTPEEFPRPPGCWSFADASSNAAELIAPPATTTTSAEYVSTAPSHSTTTRFTVRPRSEEHTSELQSRRDLVCRLLL